MWQQEPRGLSKILAAHEVLWRQVWYNRHKNREWMVERGKIKVVSRDVWEKGERNNQRHIIDEVWKGALRAAKRTEGDLGKSNIGPWTDFEWGMINGKLSPIRRCLAMNGICSIPRFDRVRPPSMPHNLQFTERQRPHGCSRPELHTPGVYTPAAADPRVFSEKI